MATLSGLGAVTAAGIGSALAVRAWRGWRGNNFAGRVAVITGGSRGLGLAIAYELAEAGARLAIVARDEAELERAARDLRGRGAQVLTVACDVRDEGQARGAIERAVSHFGAIDVLVNDAGVIQVGPVENMTVRDFEEAMAVHTYGPLYTMLAAAPHMKRQGGGRILNIASIGGKVAVPHLMPYCASKFALVGLSHGMRAELAKDGIVVTTVCPGLMRTGSHLNAQFKGQHRKEFTEFALAGALPITSIDAQRAARQIVAACRRGDAELTITIQARLLALGAAVAPGLTTDALALVARFLPGPVEDGDELRTGWESETRLAPSLLTRLSDRATAHYNGLRGHARPA